MVLTDGNVVLVSTMDHHVVVRVCKHVALPCLLTDSLVGVRSDSEATQPGHQLANLIGTTGAAMVLIRPYLRANVHRKSKNYFAARLPENGNPGVLSIVFTTTRVAQQPLRAL